VGQLPSQAVSELLVRWRAGDQEALQALVPLVYKELHTVAHCYLQNERPGHTLQTTALVHEAYLRLVDQGPFETENHSHFVSVAARLMRQILVDYARSHGAAKRGADRKVDLNEGLALPQLPKANLVALDDALNELAHVDEQQSRIVELKYFGGLTTQEIAGLLEISPSTAKREWNVAKAWLSRQIKRDSCGKTGAVGKD
jgi:RNA polymerase sigma factor (TIGR02999 family)